MTRRILISIAVLLALLCGVAAAEEVTTIASGTCGDNGVNATWVLGSTGTLTITGQGDMADYIDLSSVPWYSYLESIETVVIGNGVTGIGSNAFSSCASLSSITIPDSVTSIGGSAFTGCGEGLIIVTTSGSVAEDFANRNGITCVMR